MKTSSSRRTARAVECIRRLVSALGESARSVEQRTGLTNAQLFLLRQLDREPGLSINALAERAMTQQSTVSLLVRRLEEAGYVERTRSAADARQVLVTLTRRGRMVTRRAPRTPLGRMVESLDRLPAAEVEALIRGLGSLLRDMRVPAARGPLFEASRSTGGNARSEMKAGGRSQRRASRTSGHAST